MSRTLFRIRSLVAAALALTGTVGLPASAQTVLEEIVVSAQRRDQNIREVPIAVSELSGEGLTNIFAAGEDIRALGNRVSSLYTESSNGRFAPRFYIRGLGNTDFDLAASQPVLVVVDEVVQENVALKSFPLFDLQRVEVLKGPQGTLFGRNTPAGIVKLETVKPSSETSGYITGSFGSMETKIVEGAIGGALAGDVLAGRISFLYQDREDWIDNGFTGDSDVMGGFSELAWRGQLLFTPTDRLSVLGSVHSRDLDGTAPPFRANILGPGGDFLNDNFDRDTVFFDEGNGNPQEYDSWGGSLRIDYDLDDRYTITSITSYETADGFSLGDIDGGNGCDAPFCAAPGSPGPIPFNSVTQDGIDDLDQFTQEVRLAYTDDRMNWQAGVFYFDSTLDITTNPFFVPATTVQHENTAWAIFGQVSYDVLEDVNVTAGLRYTNDDKDFNAIASNFPVDKVSADGDDWSGDLAVLWTVNEMVNVYGRYGRGFRAPSIQGRDVAFFANPSVADSETIDSFEVGVKTLLMDGRISLDATVFYYRIEDQQLSAIGGAGNLVQLVNADEGTGKGFELDVDWLATDHLSFGLAYSFNDTELDDSALRVAPCGSGICTVTDPVDGLGNAIVDGNPFPHAPRTIVYLTADYVRDLGPGQFFASADYAYQGETNFFIYEAEEFQTNGNFEAGLRMGYRQDAWEVALFGRNITDEENVKGAIDFNNNTGFVNEPRVWGINARYNIGR